MRDVLYSTSVDYLNGVLEPQITIRDVLEDLDYTTPGTVLDLGEGLERRSERKLAIVELHAGFPPDLVGHLLGLGQRRGSARLKRHRKEVCAVVITALFVAGDLELPLNGITRW